MNRLNDARIFELITEKLQGTIHSDDDVLLQHAIARDPQVKRCWDELYEANEATGHTLLHDLEPIDAWHQLSLETEAPQPPKRLFQRVFSSIFLR